MILLTGHDVEVADWVGRKIGAPIIPPYTALGWLDEDGTLVAGIVFHTYVPNGNIDMAIALSGRLTRPMMATVADYMFRQCAARRCTARTARKNERAQSILKRIGFVQEAICAKYFSDDDAVQFRLLKREAKRWMS